MTVNIYPTYHELCKSAPLLARKGHLSIILCLWIELEVKELLDFISSGFQHRQGIFPFSLPESLGLQQKVYFQNLC
ncbi:MAG: hypothetical protein H5U06_08660 [Candidatus Aminicenantes bacterium]|nr:hypothetical protein [Candidatus Aminicenantes bacterium]